MWEKGHSKHLGYAVALPRQRQKYFFSITHIAWVFLSCLVSRITVWKIALVHSLLISIVSLSLCRDFYDYVIDKNQLVLVCSHGDKIMSEAINLPSSRMESCSVSYNLRDQEKKNPQCVFTSLMMREQIVEERLCPLLRKGCCVSLVSVRDYYRKGII